MKNIVGVIVSLIFLLFSLFDLKSEDPQIVFLDVGQGDSMIFQYQDFQMIVDGGPGDYLIQNIGKYVSIWDRKIEIIVITHPHADHYLGIEDVLERYGVETIVVAQDCSSDNKYKEIVDIAIQNDVEIVNNLDIKVGEIEINILNSTVECKKSMNLNNISLVTSISFNNLHVLNMGDLESGEEGQFFDFKNIDILKAGHHCSKTSSSLEFLENILPKYAICSVGMDNKFGHPSDIVLQRFDDIQTQYFLTYSAGDIVVNLKSKLIYNEEGKIIGKL